MLKITEILMDYEKKADRNGPYAPAWLEAGK